MAKEAITVCAVGDVILRDGASIPVLGLARPVLRAADITFGNCESAYSEEWARNGASGSGEGPKGGILAHPRNVETLADAGFDVMTFANNHHMDCGDIAFFNTLKNLVKHGIATCGAGSTIAEARAPAIVERKGTRVAFLGYSSILFPGYAAGPRTPGCAPINAHTYYRPAEHEQPGTPAIVVTIPDQGDLNAMQDDVAKAKEQADVVIVSPHWGLHFRPAVIADYETIVARAAIDAGADLVFGHHPHIMKGIQVYKGKAIVHSLGNFAFTVEDMVRAGHWDEKTMSPRRRLYRQMFGEYAIGYRPDTPSYPFHAEARRVGMCQVVIEGGKISRVSVRPCYVNTQGQPEPLDAKHPKFEEVYAYLRDISARAGFDTEFEQVGDEIHIVT